MWETPVVKSLIFCFSWDVNLFLFFLFFRDKASQFLTGLRKGYMDQNPSLSIHDLIGNGAQGSVRTVPCGDFILFCLLFSNTSHHQLAWCSMSRVLLVYPLEENKSSVFIQGRGGRATVSYADSNSLILQPHLLPWFERDLMFPVTEP